MVVFRVMVLKRAKVFFFNLCKESHWKTVRQTLIYNLLLGVNFAGTLLLKKIKHQEFYKETKRK